MDLWDRAGGRATLHSWRSRSGSPTSHGFAFVSAAQPVLYWCARNMSFWSSISFNLAVLMNLLVAFFYPFKGVRGGTHIFNFKKSIRSSRKAMTCISIVVPGCIGAIWRIPVIHVQTRGDCSCYHRFSFKSKLK